MREGHDGFNNPRIAQYSQGRHGISSDNKIARINLRITKSERPGSAHQGDRNGVSPCIDPFSHPKLADMRRRPVEVHAGHLAASFG
jgi:glutamate synthase domain-containing protein 2